VDSDRPLLTVITPVLNGAEHLPRCLASVASLSRGSGVRIEHIVADGGSTDGSLQVAQRALASDTSPVCAVLEGPDRGQSDAINRGAAVARGDWVGWLNADDWFEPGAQSMVHELRRAAEAGIDLVVGRCRFVDAHGSTVYRPEPPDLGDAAELLRPLSRWFAGRCIVQPEAFVRREAFDRVGGLDVDNHFAMDHDLWLRLIERGSRARSIGGLVASQLVHDRQKTADNLRVARAVLRNCERCVDRGVVSADRAVLAELDELRGRISRLERVFATRSGPEPFARGAAESGLREMVGSIRDRRGVAVAIGTEAARALRDSGWPTARIVSSQRVPSVSDAFDVVVVDCGAVAMGPASMRALHRALRPGSLVVLGESSLAGDLNSAERSVRAALASRLTVRQSPWGGVRLDAAEALLGWIRGRRPSAATGLAAFEMLRRTGIRLAPQVEGLCRALEIEPPALGATVMLRRHGRELSAR
jgi:glycosyltransferase involved in cell wall biosynthesis